MRVPGGAGGQGGELVKSSLRIGEWVTFVSHSLCTSTSVILVF